MLDPLGAGTVSGIGERRESVRKGSAGSHECSQEGVVTCDLCRDRGFGGGGD